MTFTTNTRATLDGPEYNWLLISRGLYWRQGLNGYTGLRSEAGRFHKTDAEKWTVAGTSAVHESDAPMYAPAWQRAGSPEDDKTITAALSIGCRAFALGDRVEKVSGASWRGRVVGFYTTALTPIGYAVESEREPGSVQIYPEKALRKVEA